MKRVFSTILSLLVLSFSYPIFSQQRNVVINTSSVDRTVITTDPDVDIWTQLEQERIATERVEQARIAAERAEQARIAAENAEQAHIADKKGTQPIAITNDFQKIFVTNEVESRERDTLALQVLSKGFLNLIQEFG